MKLFPILLVGLILVLAGCIQGPSQTGPEENVSQVQNTSQSMNISQLPAANGTVISEITQNTGQVILVKIGDILNNPKKYVGQKVIIVGRYGGWRPDFPCNYSKMGVIYRSDEIVYDDTGCIYMSGGKVLCKEGELSPWGKGIGTRIVVEGTVMLVHWPHNPTNGKPILVGPLENPTIGEIISHPHLYDGETVVIDGRFGGWSGGLNCDYKNMAMKTRSDTIIYDKTGCLYMTGNVTVLYKEGELNPMNKTSIGTRLRIKAVVRLIDGKPILSGS